jgi:hypothetical protein
MKRNIEDVIYYSISIFFISICLFYYRSDNFKKNIIKNRENYQKYLSTYIDNLRTINNSSDFKKKVNNDQYFKKAYIKNKYWELIK